jgi:hypothetical protein
MEGITKDLHKTDHSELIDDEKSNFLHGVECINCSCFSLNQPGLDKLLQLRQQSDSVTSSVHRVMSSGLTIPFSMRL